MKRHFVGFTGIDGSGKTTQAKILIHALRVRGLTVHYVWGRWHPFLVSPFVLLFKNKFMKKDGAPGENYAEAKRAKECLFTIPFFRLLWVICFFLDYGIQCFLKFRLGPIGEGLVISDRVFYDSFIDQAINLAKSRDLLINNLDSFWVRLLFPKPNTVIYLDCPANVAFQRKHDAPNVEYLENRRGLYLELARRYRWNVVDGTLPVSEIAHQILSMVIARIPKNNA